MVISWNVSNPALFPTLIHSFESRALQGVTHSNVTPLGSLSRSLRDRGKPEVPPKWRIHLVFPASFKDKERCRLCQDKHLNKGAIKREGCPYQLGPMQSMQDGVTQELATRPQVLTFRMTGDPTCSSRDLIFAQFSLSWALVNEQFYNSHKKINIARWKTPSPDASATHTHSVLGIWGLQCPPLHKRYGCQSPSWYWGLLIFLKG